MTIIEQLHVMPKEQIDAFNALLDDGTSWDSEQGKRFLANPDNALFVAYVDNIPVGFLSSHRLQRFDQRGAEVLLYEIGVNEQYQRKGVGKALIETVKSWAKEGGADQVWVITNRSNTPAVALYASTGATTESDDEQMYTYQL